MANRNNRFIMPTTHHNTRRKSNDFASLVRKFILFLIPLMIIIIVISIIFANIFKPENQIKSHFEALSTQYYEDVFYEEVIHSDNYTGDPTKTFEKYKDIGLAPITLRQFMFHDETNISDSINYLLQYCDETTTKVKFYPEPPYDKKSYRAEYTYSCNF